jgi:iron complex transport system ATP-binding protein
MACGPAGARGHTTQEARVIEGVEIAVGRDAVWLRSAAPLRVLASSVVGGDLDVTRHVVNMHVRRGYDSADPGADLHAFGRGLGITEPFVGLMTAAWTHEARIVWEEADGVRAGAAATVGLGVPVAAGVTPPVAWQPSTINVVVVLDAELERAAAVNGVITATEAKVGALAEAGIVTAEGVPATGTVTDAVVLAWTDRGPRVPYLGPGTVAGWCLARAVRQAVLLGIPRR